MSAHNRIVVRKTPATYEDEAQMAAIAMPGMAVELNSSGAVILPAITQANALKLGSFLLLAESPERSAVTAYAVGDRGFYARPQRGDRVQVLVKSGQTIVVGDYGIFEAAGSGKWIKVAGTETRYQVQFKEASGGALGADTLLLAEVL